MSLSSSRTLLWGRCRGGGGLVWWDYHCCCSPPEHLVCSGKWLFNWEALTVGSEPLRSTSACVGELLQQWRCGAPSFGAVGPPEVEAEGDSVFPSLLLQPTFLVELSKVLANPGNTQVARVAAGLQVKNSLTSKDPDVKTQYQQRWLAIDANARREIKNYVSAPNRPLSPP